MKKKILNVFTDASVSRPGQETARMIRGAIAFSVWKLEDNTCLERKSQAISGYSDNNALELIAILKACEFVRKNYPEYRVRLTTDSRTSIFYIRNPSTGNNPVLRRIADEIISMDILENIKAIKAHTRNKSLPYIRNRDVDVLAGNTRRNVSDDELIHHNPDEYYKFKPQLKDDTELLKPVDARQLVRHYYTEKPVKEHNGTTERSVRKPVVSDIKPEMSQLEKFNARFKNIRK